jgi:hypothetical protein
MNEPNPPDTSADAPIPPARRHRGRAVGLVAAGLVAGGVLAGTLGASAATTSPTTGSTPTGTHAPCPAHGTAPAAPRATTAG